MQVVDVYSGLNSALNDITAQQRQRKEDAVNNQLRQMLIEKHLADRAEEKRQRTLDAQLLNNLSNLPTTKQTPSLQYPDNPAAKEIMSAIEQGAANYQQSPWMAEAGGMQGRLQEMLGNYNAATTGPPQQIMNSTPLTDREMYQAKINEVLKSAAAGNKGLEKFSSLLKLTEPRDMLLPQFGTSPGGMEYVVTRDGKIRFAPLEKEGRTQAVGNPYEITVGGKKALVQKFSDGSVKPVVQDSSTTVKVQTGKGQYGKPPNGYRFTEDGNLEAIHGGPADKLPSGLQEDLGTTRQLLETLKDVRDKYKTNYVGILDNLRGLVTGKTDIGANPDEQDFRSLVQNQFNIQGKLRSGAAWTAPEISRLTKELPNLSDGETAFSSKLNNSIKFLERKEKQILGNRTSTVGTGTPSPTSKTLDRSMAQRLLQRAGGDKNKARELARKEGYSF